ncbi:MAG TPA: hypothetical protein VEJ18_06715 [Planctomycetota bacterium]|nr:hypothetical protein [Planctomycetota bacterium]
MTALLAWLAQDAPPTDWLSRLLGFDRVRIEENADWSITWHHMPAKWVLFLVIIPAILLLVGFLYRSERRDVGRGVKIVLSALRAAALLLVLLLLMGPVLTVETIKSRNNYVLVLLDDSRSMQKSDPLQTEEERTAVARVTGLSQPEELRRLTRADLVKKVLENPQLKILEELEKKLNVAYFTFSSTASAKESREALLKDYGAAACVGTETAIGDAVRAALNALRGQFIAGVVVVTDGKNNAGIATKEIAAQLKQRYLPIYTVAAGLPRTPKDVALLELEARDAVLANDDYQVRFKVSSFGYDGETAPVGLWVYPLKEADSDTTALEPKELDRMIAEARKEGDAEVALRGQNQKHPVTMRFTPKEPGEYLLILRADPRPEENTPSNNYLTHRLRVADDKIKVLYVEHPPRFEFRFLKSALLRDPKILVHTFLTSADEGFPQDHTRSDDPLFRQPLQEFPRDLKSLLEFDVLILGDAEPSRLGPEAARNIETFVSEFGGGVIFISGERYNPRSLAGTPLANLLPVIPEETRDLYDQDRVYDQTLPYVLTSDGRTHPITTFKEFKGDRDRNAEHWEDRDNRGDGMLGIRWFARVKKLKAGASPLVEVAVPGESGRRPLFVTQHVGRGRVFWSATDETWLWRRLAGDYPWFYPFWQQGMYWVREGKLMGARRYRISVDKERYTRGEPVKIYSYAYDEKYELRTDPTLDVFVDPPAGSERIKVTLRKDPTREGFYVGEYRPSNTGLFRAWAGEEDESTRAYARFTVFIPDREEDEPILDVATLKELAQESYGGEYFPIDQVDRLNKVVQRSQNQLRETREDDLWDAPLAFLLFAALVTAEWILRKMNRML